MNSTITWNALPLLSQEQYTALGLGTTVRWTLWLVVGFLLIFPGIVAYMVWLERKVAAVECHRSQFSTDVGGSRAGRGEEEEDREARGEGWAGEAVRRRALEEGRRAGVRSAEGFRRLRLGA